MAMIFQYLILIVCAFSVFREIGSVETNKSQTPNVRTKKEDDAESVSLPMSKTLPTSSKIYKSSSRASSSRSSRGPDDDNSRSKDELIKRSATNHNPYSHGGHEPSPYVDMVFKLAAEAVEASHASQMISHQLSGHGRGMAGKVRVPLYRQSYPVLFQHGDIMHSQQGGLPYPYVPTMKGSGIIVRRQGGGGTDSYGSANTPAVSQRVESPGYGQRNARRPQNAIY